MSWGIAFSHTIGSTETDQMPVFLSRAGLSCQNLSRFEWTGLQRPVFPLDEDEARNLEIDWSAVLEGEGSMFILGRDYGVAAGVEAEAEAVEN